MKKILLSLLLVITVSAVDAQTDEAAYKKDPHIPKFSLLLPDSTWFTSEQVPEKYSHTVIIYFSPDCSHCQHEAKGLVQLMDSLKNSFFVFAAYKPLEDIKGFAEYYGLNKFENVRTGRDPRYYIPSFYRVKYTPFIAIYDRNGLLQKIYDTENTPVPEPSELAAFLNRN